MVFADSASATAGINDLGRSIKQIELQWGPELRVDPLANDLAVMAAPYHEIRTDSFGQRVDESGYFTGVVEFKGGRWQFRVPVYLGEVPPDSVRVQLYASAARGHPAAHEVMTREAAIPGAANGYLYGAVVDSSRPAGDFTPRVIPWHEEVAVPAEASLIAWQR